MVYYGSKNKPDAGWSGFPAAEKEWHCSPIVYRWRMAISCLVVGPGWGPSNDLCKVIWTTDLLSWSWSGLTPRTSLSWKTLSGANFSWIRWDVSGRPDWEPTQGIISFGWYGNASASTLRRAGGGSRWGSGYHCLDCWPKTMDGWMLNPVIKIYITLFEKANNSSVWYEKDNKWLRMSVLFEF